MLVVYKGLLAKGRRRCCCAAGLRESLKTMHELALMMFFPLLPHLTTSARPPCLMSLAHPTQTLQQASLSLPPSSNRPPPTARPPSIMSSYLSSFLSSAFGTGAAFDSSDESDGENQSPVNATSSSTTTKAVSKPTSGDAESSSVHWLGVETDEKEVRVVCDNRAAKEVLGKCSDTTPLNLIAICGAARQGKSFLMNMLAGEDCLFKISSSQDPCTQGVDLSRKVVSWGAFHRHDEIAMKKHERRSIDHASSEPAPKIAFVDVEGQGDRDLTYDANLVCPVVLTSRAVIFNWKDSLQRDRLLNLLAVMQRAAFNVATEEDDGGEEGGGGKAPAEQSKIFGHLHIVFRDWAYDGTKETVYKTLFTQERSLAPDAVARNQIRSVLENAFESISILN